MLLKPSDHLGKKFTISSQKFSAGISTLIVMGVTLVIMFVVILISHLLISP